MSIKTILFDLDGTLLPMDQDKFVSAYFKALTLKAIPFGYDPQDFVKMIWKGTGAMVKNDGSSTNEGLFWKVFVAKFGQEVLKMEPVFRDFYLNEFEQVRSSCGYTDEASKLVKQLKAEGYRLILATNPIFPAVATKARIRWAGLDESDFDLVTTYENCSFSKPNLKYYEAIMQMYDLDPKECLMIGNDVDEDMIASELGLNVYLCNRDIINKSAKDISSIPQGSLLDVLNYLGDSIDG